MMTLDELEKAVSPINNSDRLAQSGLSILHILPTGYQPKKSGLYRKTCGYAKEFKRGMTVAYRREGGLISIATAVCHPNDQFSRKVGTRTAVENYESGKIVQIPMIAGSTASETIFDLFQ